VSEARRKAGDLARESLAEGDPTGWFEKLYAQAAGDTGAISWADLVPNPNLTAWLDREKVEGNGRRALKIGCGLGDDAEELSRRGFLVTAFDVSETAIDWCRERFPASTVRYVVQDLLAPRAEWERSFDFVLESYTLQVLPPDVRAQAIAQVARYVALGGELLVIARGREPGDPVGMMPWPLLRLELDALERAGLEEASFEDFIDTETPPVRRFRVCYRRPQWRRP
jgi:SAM-dependent methyltransferase